MSKNVFQSELNRFEKNNPNNSFFDDVNIKKIIKDINVLQDFEDVFVNNTMLKVNKHKSMAVRYFFASLNNQLWFSLIRNNYISQIPYEYTHLKDKMIEENKGIIKDVKTKTNVIALSHNRTAELTFLELFKSIPLSKEQFELMTKLNDNTIRLFDDFICKKYNEILEYKKYKLEDKSIHCKSTVNIPQQNIELLRNSTENINDAANAFLLGSVSKKEFVDNIDNLNIISNIFKNPDAFEMLKGLGEAKDMAFEKIDYETVRIFPELTNEFIYSICDTYLCNINNRTCRNDCIDKLIDLVEYCEVEEKTLKDIAYFLINNDVKNIRTQPLLMLVMEKIETKIQNNEFFCDLASYSLKNKEYSNVFIGAFHKLCDCVMKERLKNDFVNTFKTSPNKTYEQQNFENNVLYGIFNNYEFYMEPKDLSVMSLHKMLPLLCSYTTDHFNVLSQMPDEKNNVLSAITNFGYKVKNLCMVIPCSKTVIKNGVQSVTHSDCYVTVSQTAGKLFPLIMGCFVRHKFDSPYMETTSNIVAKSVRNGNLYRSSALDCSIEISTDVYDTFNLTDKEYNAIKYVLSRLSNENPQYEIFCTNMINKINTVHNFIDAVDKCPFIFDNRDFEKGLNKRYLSQMATIETDSLTQQEQVMCHNEPYTFNMTIDFKFPLIFFKDEYKQEYLQSFKNVLNQFDKSSLEKIKNNILEVFVDAFPKNTNIDELMPEDLYNCLILSSNAREMVNVVSEVQKEKSNIFKGFTKKKDVEDFCL